jgi:signal transduction histidine kinase
VDPAFLIKSSVPVLVNIESIVADGKMADLSDKTQIPPSPRRVTINYAGLSLTVPEHVHFRYMLDGFDRQWSGTVGAREAVYTNLGPGTYRFRVIASNSEGTWNNNENAYTFEVRPAFWQTWWFRILCFAAVGSLVLGIYQLRLRKATHQLNVRFEERLAERTRIAQELHDTLLQGVLSASMQLNVANDQIEENAPFKPLVTRVLELMGRVVDDGRSAVRGLRVSRDGTQALDQAFSRVPQELAVQGSANFRVITEGPQRTLHPVIRDEVYRIGREALVNAFRHSEAKNIEVELEYATHELIMRVRDDGRGIDPHVLQTGREGHWGLSGMRERAGKIGAKLKVWSKTAEGTAVELRVPARIAFDTGTSSGVSKWFTKKPPRKDE